MSARPAVGSDRAVLERTRLVGAIKRIEDGNERMAERAKNGDGKARRSKEESAVCFEWQYNTAAKQWSTV